MSIAKWSAFFFFYIFDSFSRHIQRTVITIQTTRSLKSYPYTSTVQYSHYIQTHARNTNTCKLLFAQQFTVSDVDVRFRFCCWQTLAKSEFHLKNERDKFGEKISQLQEVSYLWSTISVDRFDEHALFKWASTTMPFMLVLFDAICFNSGYVGTCQLQA